MRERVFNNGSYKILSQNMKGIDSLRERLSRILFHYLKQELPILKEELDSMARATQLELQSIDKARVMISDQRIYLTDLFNSAYHIVVMGMNGNNENAFFGSIDINVPIHENDNSRRFHAILVKHDFPAT